MAGVNNNGVWIDARNNEKTGKSYMDFYDNDPREPHNSIHVEFNSDGTGMIKEKNGGEKKSTKLDFRK